MRLFWESPTAAGAPQPSTVNDDSLDPAAVQADILQRGVVERPQLRNGGPAAALGQDLPPQSAQIFGAQGFRAFDHLLLQQGVFGGGESPVIFDQILQITIGHGALHQGSWEGALRPGHNHVK